MKRIIDFSGWSEERTDTTGNGGGMISSYIVILAFASNPNWRRQLKDSSISKEDVVKVIKEVFSWCFEGVGEKLDLGKVSSRVDALYAAVCAEEELTFDESGTVNERFGKRTFRTGPVLRSVLVHLGIATFKKCKIETFLDAQKIVPESTDADLIENWATSFNFAFSNLPEMLKKLVTYSSLEIHHRDKISLLCSESRASGSAEARHNSAKSSAGNVVYGKGKHVLLYGPPGTGKTRDANRLIQDGIRLQIEEQSGGRVTAADMLGRWDDKRNAILREMRKFVAVTQFHATYSYEDFIEGLRPLKNAKGDIKYETVDGVFLALWRKATGKYADIPCRLIEGDVLEAEIDPYFARLYDLDAEEGLDVIIGERPPTSGRFRESSLRIEIQLNRGEISNPSAVTHLSVRGQSWSPEYQYFLLVDEINRGKVSKILGELLFAMAADTDDQLPEVRTQYSKTPLLLPVNLHIIATMNTCDKSVDILDQAIKRRFELHELMPLGESDLAINQQWKNLNDWFQSSFSVSALSLLSSINDVIMDSGLVDYDRQIGHSYFFKTQTQARKGLGNIPEALWPASALFSVYFGDIFPILQEFFIDSRQTLEQLVPSGFLDAKGLSLNGKTKRLLSRIQEQQPVGQEEQKLLNDFLSFIKSLSAGQKKTKNAKAAS